MKELSLYETRVIGALIEKKATTPDQYPLSLNALVNACNQKSSRDPVLNLSESNVQEVLDELIRINLVSEVVIGSRVKKYQHRFCNTEFSQLHLASGELAVICCLFLRGPQTPGELRGRTTRQHDFKSLEEVEIALQDLMERDGGPLVRLLPKEPGRRELRYMHLLSGQYLTDEKAEDADFSTEKAAAVSRPSSGEPTGASNSERISLLEEQISILQSEVEILKKNWQDLNE